MCICLYALDYKKQVADPGQGSGNKKPTPEGVGLIGLRRWATQVRVGRLVRGGRRLPHSNSPLSRA